MFKRLGTEGGKLAVIIGMIVYLSAIAVYLHATHSDPQETGRVLISNAITSLMTLLLTRLGKNGNSKGKPDA
jgi:hypothetical protein